jgi:hypothetical protein
VYACWSERESTRTQIVKESKNVVLSRTCRPFCVMDAIIFFATATGAAGGVGLIVASTGAAS